MPGTDIPAGRIRAVGKVHGVPNFIVEWDGDDPDDWEFKQFVSQEQLEKFATENNLVIIMENQT